MPNDKQVISTALERFRLCQEREAETRERALEELRFSLGEQWDDDVKNARENDPDGARPCLTVDKLDQYIRQVVNDARQNKPSIKPRPKDSGADVDTAEVLEGIVRHIEDQSSADIAYDVAVEMAARCGFGFVRVVTDYCDDEGFEQDIYIKPVLNPFGAYLDCDRMELDGRDSQYAFVFEDTPREQFKQQYPKADAVDFAQLPKEAASWASKDCVRVAEYWEVVHESKTVWQAQDGTASEEEIEGAVSRTLKKRKVIWRKITAKDVLEEREWPSKYIGIVPVYGHIIDVAGKREIHGLIKPAMDAQRMYNYAASAFVERVALAPKAPFVGTAEQFEGHEEEWARANTANLPYLTYNNVDGVAPPQRQMAADVPAGWVAVMQGMEHDIQAALGMYNASVGAPSNEKSGKAIVARQREADVSTFHITDNLARAIRQVGRIVIDLIPKVIDTQRVMRILGEDGTHKFAKINPALPVARYDVKDVNGDVIDTIYNPGVGRYDVTVTVGPAYSTKRQEAAEFLTQVVQSSPEMMHVAGDLMFKSLDMPYAEELSERMKKMLPPPLQENEQAQIPPQVQGQLQQMGQMIEQLKGALMNADAAANDADIKRKELELKDRETCIKEFDAETKRIQVVGAAMTPEQVQAIVMQTLHDALTPMQCMDESQEMPHLMQPSMDGAPMQEGPPMPPPEMMPNQDQPPMGGFFTPEGGDA